MSDSVVVGDGVGGRNVLNDFRGSAIRNLMWGEPLARLSTCGFMPLGLGVGRMMG
jgi:hypothetical protein